MICPVFLDESAYGRFVSWPDSRGWNKSTHLAQIEFGQGEEPAYVKLIYLDHWPALANEAIGWHLAHACGIPAPERAAILTASADQWRAWLGKLPEDCPQEGDIAACYRAPQSILVNLLVAAQDINAYAASTRRDQKAVFIIEPDDDAPLTAKERKTIADLIGNECWKLETSGFRAPRNVTTAAMAQDIRDWAMTLL